MPAGAALPGEDVHTSRTPPVPIKGWSTGKASAPLPTEAGYGVFRPKQGPAGTWHWGVDLTASVTVPVVAPEVSTVAYVWADNETPPWVGYGPAGVLLKGASGVYHLLAHLDPTAWSTSSSRPAVGQHVDVGEQVGFPAPTGTEGLGVAQPHTHWEVRLVPVDGPSTRAADTLDPIAWLAGKAVQKSGSGGFPWWLVLLFLYAISKNKR